ncbi:thiamine phosphate synthase [Candidatus Latescibacterota bacterium]
MITDSELSKRGILSDVEQALKAGCMIFQYREKNKNASDMVREAAQIKELCAGHAIFLVNDRMDVALAVDADGVHIGQEDMPFEAVRRLLGDEKIIGLTAHNVEESVEAEVIGADYIGLSPIFETSTKKEAGTGCGSGMITAVRERVKLPIVAIGGINRNNVRDVIRAGADAVSAISAVVCSDDVYVETHDFIALIREVKAG